MKHKDSRTLDINGIGRIGKFTLWHHVGRKIFDRIVVNIGRNMGTLLDDIAFYPARVSNTTMPKDILIAVIGTNENDYNPEKHLLVSNASCTTTCLAHMIKPVLDHFGPKKILSASMTTVHAVTARQNVLNRLPKEEKTDLRKNRSGFNNITLTTTGPALIYEGRCEGVITEAPAGDNGFGYDPVFFYPSLGKTFAELDGKEKIVSATGAKRWLK